MREVFGEILEKKNLINFELLPFLAHLSRRLKGELIFGSGELIVYRSIRRPSVSASVSASVSLCVRKHFQT